MTTATVVDEFRRYFRQVKKQNEMLPKLKFRIKQKKQYLS